MKHTAIIDCNNFYVSCERVFNPKIFHKPVIILSNNDGCVVSRSQEAKDLGIKMGVPLFQIQDEIEQFGIKVFSSNYTLYGDMSARVMELIKLHSPAVEVYSIDEAFAVMEENKYLPSVEESCIQMRSHIRQGTGIPTSVGIAPTKTLAKLAVKHAKKETSGVFALTDKKFTEEVLAETNVIDLWGIHTGLAKRIYGLGLRSALQLRDMDIRTAKKILTIVGARMVLELRGIPCIPWELERARNKNIACGRSFKGGVTTESELREALLNFISIAAERMRKRKLTAKAVNVYLMTDKFRDDQPQYFPSSMVKLAYSTDSTRELIPAAMRGLNKIFRYGYRYRKAGVDLLNLQPAESETSRLFGQNEYDKEKVLMETIDDLNRKHGRGSLRFGWGAKEHINWQMQRQMTSPHYTTRIGDILTI